MKKTRKDNCLCKAGFPKARVASVTLICPGNAKKFGLRVTGRRNALGQILGERECEWFSGTSGILAHVLRSNTNVQTPCRLPILPETHDPGCKRGACLDPLQSRRMMRVAQRALKSCQGYFGGYTSKRQPVGKFELKKSIETLPLFGHKLEARAHSSASSHLALVCNRAFSALEGRGILRTGIEEVLLASQYNPQDPLAAEFIRTCRHQFFFGHSFLKRLERLQTAPADVQDLGWEHRPLPRSSLAANRHEQSLLYGLRPCTDALHVLSPWEFSSTGSACLCIRPRRTTFGAAGCSLPLNERSVKSKANAFGDQASTILSAWKRSRSVLTSSCIQRGSWSQHLARLS